MAFLTTPRGVSGDFRARVPLRNSHAMQKETMYGIMRNTEQHPLEGARRIVSGQVREEELILAGAKLIQAPVCYARQKGNKR